jgi:hypothetical protein
MIMKKMLLISLVISLAVLTGCTKEEVNVAGNGNSIGFDAMPTKTRVATTTLQTLTSFTVAANLTADAVATDFSHFKEINVLRKAGTSNWDYSPKQYWPGGATKVDFYAYSPAGSPNVKGFTNNSTAASTKAVIDYIVPFSTKPAVGGTPAETQEDLLVARTLEKTDGTVQLNFVHALSRINFSAVNLNSADMTVYVDHVELTGLASRGTLALGQFDTSTPNSKVWSNPTVAGKYEVQFVSGGVPVYGSGSAQTLYPLNTPEQGLMVLPQTVSQGANETVKVVYHLRNGSGQSSSSKTAIFDLTKDAAFDFNVNTQYNFQFAFTAQGDITFNPLVDGYWDDVDVIFPAAMLPSNTYMVTPDGFPISIPVYSGSTIPNPLTTDVGQVSRAIYGAPAGAALATNWLTGANLKAGILWTDVNPATNTVVKSLELTGTVAGNNLRITVTPGASKGNALVILYDDKGVADQYNSATDEIKWSWLIWNVDYTPTGTWMDRNLGAITNNAAGQANTYGFMFQWGRKDPLQHAVYNTSTLAKWYAYNGGTATLTDGGVVAVTSGTTVSDWVKNPAAFYTAATNIGDHSGLGTRNDNLWSPTTKTVYDPCPAGWTVSRPIPNSVESSLSPWSLGYTIPGYGGYYPAAGIRVYSTGAINSVDVMTYWYSNIYGADASSMHYDDGGSGGEEIWRVFGLSVRCVKF